MKIPDEAVGAAATTLESIGSVGPNMTPEYVARRAIEAALPAICHAIAEEMLRSIGSSEWRDNTMWQGGVRHAARIVRGGTR